MKINIIGAGRLGLSLARALIENLCAESLTICNRHFEHALKAVNTLGTGTAVETIADLPRADITFITAPDDAIAGIASQLATSHRTAPGQIIAHCSGVLNSEVLSPLRDSGCVLASIHPLRAFRANHVPFNAFQHCDCVVEGDTPAVVALTTLFTNMGSHIIPIMASKKATYHAAAVMASNYVVTLASCAFDLFHEAGLTDEQAQKITTRLMQSSLANLQSTTHASLALTGPLVRGDINTISMHLNAIQSEPINALYRAAGLATLPLTDLNNPILAALKKQLKGESSEA
jgi:predicted short-subunit dehydrogenase-like oxidoreductase (DUF2520 family)